MKRKIAAGILVLATFGPQAPALAAEPEACQAPRFSDVGWTDISATTATSALVLQALGYKPDVQILSVAVTFESLKQGDTDADAACEMIYGNLKARGLDVLYDDRDARAGEKFATMDLIGLPWRITVGPRGLKNGVVELTSRRTGESEEMSPDAAVARIAEIYEGL